MGDPLHSIGPINVLIPLAGKGTRFTEAGYDIPKPLIPVNGMPMIEASIRSLGLPLKSSLIKYVYVVLAEHEKLGVTDLLTQLTPGCTIIQQDGYKEGALCSALLAKSAIDNNLPLIIANTDQIVEWNPTDAIEVMRMTGAFGLLLTFPSKKGTHYSFCRVYDEEAEVSAVTEVTEKVKISDTSNTGVYVYLQGNQFVKYAERSIANGRKYNNEYYIAPMYNEAIEDGLMVLSYKTKVFFSLGTPTELQEYERKCAQG